MNRLALVAIYLGYGAEALVEGRPDNRLSGLLICAPIALRCVAVLAGVKGTLAAAAAGLDSGCAPRSLLPNDGRSVLMVTRTPELPRPEDGGEWAERTGRLRQSRSGAVWSGSQIQLGPGQVVVALGPDRVVNAAKQMLD